MTRALSLAALAALLMTSQPPAARADVLGSSENEAGRITRIGQGVFQLGVDAILTTSYQKEESTDVFRANIIGRGMFRYFISDNLGIGAHAGVLYRKTGEARDLGFIGDVSARWHARLGLGIFWAPEVTAGLLFGGRSVEVPGTGTALESDLSGFAAGVKLPLVFFVNPRFSVEAGPEFLLTVGSITPKTGGDSTSFSAIDGGFNVGAVYSF